jgi:hypothetical protein
MHRPSLPPADIPGSHFCYNLSRPQDQSAAGRKNSNHSIGKQTRDLTAFSAAPQLTVSRKQNSIFAEWSFLLKHTRMFLSAWSVCDYARYQNGGMFLKSSIILALLKYASYSGNWLSSSFWCLALKGSRMKSNAIPIWMEDFWRVKIIAVG